LASEPIDLFVYGTLMVPDIMREAGGHEGPSEPACLSGYRRGRIDGETYPGIVSTPGDCVEGMLYRGLTEAVIMRLDRFEGEFYARLPVRLSTDAGIMTAQAYVIRPLFEHIVTAEPWSLDRFLQQGFDRFVSEYVGFDTDR
jgi:gamma-glutamylcyclotransferase (GGCT)/AIG2-like uncharacterized protein YtfP